MEINEPVWINCLQGDNDETQYKFGAKRSSVFKEARDYWQPIVDIIRSKCDNIIFIPGFRFQTLYSGFTDYPIMGDNIGYAVHSYPRMDVREHWEKEVLPTWVNFDNFKLEKIYLQPFRPATLKAPEGHQHHRWQEGGGEVKITKE